MSASSGVLDGSGASAHLLRGAYSLIANTAITSALGMAFWVLAARLYSHDSVGRDAALISAMVELSTVCQLNLGNGIVRFFGQLGARRRVALVWAYALTAAVAVALGSAFVVAAPEALPRMSFLSNDVRLQVGFVAALALWGIFALQDAVLTAARRAPWIPIENGLFGALKLIALPVLLIAAPRHGVFAAWALPMAVLVIPVNVLIFARALPHGQRDRGAAAHTSHMNTKQALRFLGQDYFASIFTQATLTILPLLVLSSLGAVASAYFAIPFMIVMAFDTVAYGSSAALVVEGTARGGDVRTLARVFARRVLVLIVPGALLLIVAAPLAMLPFGGAYAAHSAGVLRLLACASLPRAAIAMFAAIARVQARGVRLAAVELALLVATIGLSVPLRRAYGLDGVAGAWLAANLLVCVLIAPWLVRFLSARGNRSEASTAS